MDTTFYKNLDIFMKYLWNAFDYDECIEIFGDDLGRHIWSKWLDALSMSSLGSPAIFFSMLDKNTCQKIIDAAIKWASK